MALLAAAGVIVFTHTDKASAFQGAFVVDGFSRFTKLLVLIGSASSILMAQEFYAIDRKGRFELPVLMLLATLGMMLMVSASSFIALYMGLELQSLALYVLASFNRDHCARPRRASNISSLVRSHRACCSTASR